MLGMVLALALAAGEQGGEDAPGPSMGLLEYLVLFESVDGDWMDPELLPAETKTRSTFDEDTEKNKAGNERQADGADQGNRPDSGTDADGGIRPRR